MGSELVLGDPEIRPAPIDLSPLSQSAGAKPPAIVKQKVRHSLSHGRTLRFQSGQIADF